MFEMKKGLVIIFIVLLLQGCLISHHYYPVESIYNSNLKISDEIEIEVITLTNQQQKINAIKEIHNSIRNPFVYPDLDYNQIKSDLNLDKQFELLKHISIQDSFKIDFLRVGAPILYTYKDVSFNDSEEYLKNLRNNHISEDDKPFLNNIQIDGSPEGFFEFVILEKIGEQFLLFWHSNYNDLVLIADSLEIDEIVESINDNAQNRMSLPLEMNNIEKMKLNKLSKPTVRFYPSYVFVSFLSFTKWGGFFKENYYIKRTFPHKIIKKGKYNVKEYRCGYRL